MTEIDSKTLQQCPAPNGTLVIIGGHEQKGETPEKKVQEEKGSGMQILETFIKACKVDKPQIEVITSASSEGNESFEDYRKAFEKMGLSNVGHLHHDNRAETVDDRCIERVRAADGIFFSGGDQLKLTSIYGGTNILTLLKERYIYNHLVIGGTSAGAMAMSTPMIYAGSQEDQMIAGQVKITTGLEFVRDVCIDTHFVDRGRFVRMAQVIATNPTCIGIGIEEDTAIVLRGGTEAEVIGSGVIIVIDGHDSTDNNITKFNGEKTLSIRDLKVHILSDGDKYNIPRDNPPHL
jgi:cyanophycinase